MTPPDFSKAVVRPALGNLLVVRQKLISYEAGEISHIENILEGELYRRSANRAESSEITTVEERETTQFDERDLQSTERNEIASESQKEAGKEAIATQGQSTTKDYGKLVENTKSNYARSVTDRAVNNLTQRVKQQRTVREKKSFAEKSVHEFNNVGGDNKVRGIYQWVDKNYKTRIMNCGTRYLYDVVVPEPAAFLIETLKNSSPPEPFPLVKPTPPPFASQELYPGFYQAWADYYEVSGSVEPPPEEFLETTAKAEHPEVAKKIDAFGASVHAFHYDAFKIQIPKGYKAVSGYVQRTGLSFLSTPPTGEQLILYIGEFYSIRFGEGAAPQIPFANHSFTMNGESGELPVTVQTFGATFQFNYAIGIICRREDKAFEKWQLKTYATLMAGYRRQQERYEDKLAQRQALLRAQMARAQTLAHDPSIEQAELRKAFIQTILSEHLTSVVATPIPGLFPVPLDYTKKWAAMVSFFERAFEWENMLYFYYPYFWGRPARWGELVLIQHLDPKFEEFLKAGAARVVVPIRPGFEVAMAHYHETGDVWMGKKEMPDMFSDFYVSIIDEIKARNLTPDEEQLVEEWDVKLPTTLVMLKDDAVLPTWT